MMRDSAANITERNCDLILKVHGVALVANGRRVPLIASSRHNISLL
jgi:hypothetical protein